MTLTETIKQTDKMNRQEFQILFFHMLTKASTKYKKYHLLENFMKSTEPIREYDLEKENEKILQEKKERKLGFLKGTEYYIAEDFDAPLDDLKDYMY